MRRFFSFFLLIFSCSIVHTKTLTQTQERVLGESLQSMSPPQQPRLAKAENFFLYELNRVCDLAEVNLDFPISLRIIDDNQINAFATSGSFIFIYTGILKQLTDVSEIMGVLCHEITHTKEHHIRRRIAQMDELNNQRMLMLAALPIIVLWPGVGEMIYSLSLDQSFLKQQQFSQQMEYEADAGAVMLMESAGFDSAKLISGFESIGRYQCYDRAPKHFSYYASHPLTLDRIRRIKESRHDGSASLAVIYRSQLDYSLILSQLNEYPEIVSTPHNQDQLFIAQYQEHLKNNTIEKMLEQFPQSIVLKIDYWQQLRQQKRWDELLSFHKSCASTDKYWGSLPLVQEGLVECYYHTMTPTAFLRKHQRYLVDAQAPASVMKYLAHTYLEQGNQNFYYLCQAKYYLQLGAYEEALKQLQHPSVDEDNFYYDMIQKEAELKNNTLEELSRR